MSEKKTTRRIRRSARDADARAAIVEAAIAETAERAKTTEPTEPARKTEAERPVVDRIASAVGRLAFGGEPGSPTSTLGFGILEFYGEVTGDSILASFARGAREGREERAAEMRAEKEETKTRASSDETTESSPPYPNAGRMYSLDDYRPRPGETPEQKRARIRAVFHDGYADFMQFDEKGRCAGRSPDQTAQTKTKETKR